MLLVRVNILILFLAISYADVNPNTTPNTPQKRHDDNCNCESIGPWQPVFKPSPIVHSDFPEHHPTHIFDIYSSRSDLKVVPHILVPVVNPVAYTLHHDFGSREKPDLKYSLLDSSITESTDSNGKPVIKWEHYGDIKQLSVKYKGGSSKNKNNKNRLYNHKLEENKPLPEPHEDKFKETESNEEERYNHSAENPQHVSSETDTSCNENNKDEKFFNSESFFDGSYNSQEDMDVSKDLSQENNLNTQSHLEESSIEVAKENTKTRKPATSYAFISSLFSGVKGIKTSHYNDVNVKQVPSVKSPYSSAFTNINGRGHAHFVLHDKPAWFKHFNRKYNDGKPNKYQTKINPYGIYEHQSDDARSNGYPRYSNHVGSYYPLNRDYLLGDFWKNTRNMEKMRPPPLGQTPTWFMNAQYKKPRTINLKRDNLINNKKPFSYVYIIKTNKESNPIFISHSKK